MKQLRLKVGNLVLTYNEKQTEDIISALTEFLVTENQRVLVLTLCNQETIDNLDKGDTCGKHLPIC